MSFVQALRMRNMFPVNSDLGSAKVDLSGQDPMYEIIDAYNEQVRQQEMNRPLSGLQSVGRSVSNRPTNIESNEPELRFGGVVGQSSNSGADILNRSKKSAEDLYASYDDPINNQDIKGPSNDQINLERYFKRKNEETETEAKADAIKENSRIRQEAIDSRGWETVTITDPANPEKQISARHNKITGATLPIELPNNGIITRRGSATDIQKRQDLENEKLKRRESIKEKAQSSLDLVDKLLIEEPNPTDPTKPNYRLTDEAQWATGGSSWTGKIPLPTPAYAGASRLNQLSKIQVLDLINEMKSQSKTGATGMGNMSNRDLAVLQGAASLLERPGLDEQTIKDELIKVKGVFKRALEDFPPAGTIKVFPNGKRGKSDGERWEMIEG